MGRGDNRDQSQQSGAPTRSKEHPEANPEFRAARAQARALAHLQGYRQVSERRGISLCFSPQEQAWSVVEILSDADRPRRIDLELDTPTDPRQVKAALDSHIEAARRADQAAGYAVA